MFHVSGASQVRHLVAGVFKEKLILGVLKYQNWFIDF